MTTKIYKTLIILILLTLPKAAFAQDQAEMQEYLDTLTESQQQQVLGLLQAGVANGKWKEGPMFDGIAPGEDMFSAMQYYPGTETVQDDEMRVTIMGSSPAIREDQSGMSMYIVLGNGDNFIFDMGTGSLKNFMAMGVPLMKTNKVFLSHLHADHLL
jgi:hypothetical protein